MLTETSERGTDLAGSVDVPHRRSIPSPDDGVASSSKEPFRYDGIPVAWRRALVLLLNVVTISALGAGVHAMMAPDGIDVAEAVMLAGFLLATPFTVLGFWNAVIGLVLLRGPADAARSVYPFFRAEPKGRPTTLRSRTALTVFLRNEDPEPIFRRMAAMRASLHRTGQSRHFRFVFLSDTDDAAIAAAEDAAFSRFLSETPDGMAQRPLLRRRADNAGFKAGNLRDFLVRHGEDYEFFLPLDSDSLMCGDAVTRMVETMERFPRIGILQSLVVGMPATSGFARIFQFGMRHGMRSFTMGSAWWQADCGPYWGHNAVIRTKPFVEHCDLPVLPGKGPLSGHPMSHDQLEAVFMRRAGYEVRVIPIETRSFETNPPTLPDFAGRDLRWCQGNMQYLRFLAEPGLHPISRFQLLQAILMYVAPPAWLAMTIAATAKGLGGGFHPETLQLGLGLFLAIFLLSTAPKLAGVVDVALSDGGAKRYGGWPRFASSAILELAVSMLLAPIVAVYVTIFLAGLPFGRSVGWNGQNRERLGVGWRDACRAMWPQTALGLAVIATLPTLGLAASLWILPIAAGLCLAVPFTVLTASPAFGSAMTRLGLFAIPEETALPRVLRGVVSPAARRWRRADKGEAVVPLSQKVTVEAGGPGQLLDGRPA